MSKFAEETWLSRRQAKEISKLRKENERLRARLAVLEPVDRSKPKESRRGLTSTELLKALNKSR